MAQKLLTPASGWSGQLRKQAAHRSSSSSSLTWSPSATVEQISDNLSFRPANSSHPHTSSAHATESSADGDSSRRPVVLIYAWLAAKSRHIHKFSDFYQAKGFDVLHIKVNPSQMLWPPHAQSVVAQILSFLTSPAHHSQPILVHGFSVGGYVYGETLVQIMSNAELAESMSHRIRGQVFDSPVDFEGVPRGVGMALSTLRPLQVAVKCFLDAYTSFFRRQVTDRYVLSEQTFHRNPLRTPSLVFYSKADVVALPAPIDSLIAMWREVGVPVYTHCWENTRHVSHFHADPLTYTALLNQFLASIGFVSDDDEVEQLRHAMPASKL